MESNEQRRWEYDFVHFYASPLNSSIPLIDGATEFGKIKEKLLEAKQPLRIKSLVATIDSFSSHVGC